ncbi:PIN domain-containing protein [Chroococcidiopsis sp.]|uniref:PIN domain-containing protein n=1 Tax=Chroococcidiopsis sp. TaxID=3088168 RepID=UPI003F2D6AA4
MTAKFFVDTNILIYAYDTSNPDKQTAALQTLDRLVTSGTGVISTQVLAEFFVTVTSDRKFPNALSIVEAGNRIQNYILAWEVVEVTGAIVLEAIRGVKEYQLSFWDAQIWATAKLNQIPVVYSEDFNVGAIIEGVRFINPLDPPKFNT